MQRSLKDYYLDRLDYVEFVGPSFAVRHLKTVAVILRDCGFYASGQCKSDSSFGSNYMRLPYQMADDGIAGREFPPWRCCDVELQVFIAGGLGVEHFVSHVKS
jgi:hypothetical protein